MVIFVNKKSSDNPYILVVNCENRESESNVVEVICKSVKKHVIKSKTISVDGIELTFEVRLKDMTTEFVNNVASTNGVTNAVLVSYNGDYMS